MSLLQISEPNQSANPHEQRYALGIDLGTTRSMVAVVRSGKATVVPDNTNTLAYDATVKDTLQDNQDNLLPSVVYYGDADSDEPVVGQRALEHMQDDPSNTIVSSKRFMGRSLSDIKFSHPYHLKGQDGDMPVFVTAQGDKSPVEVAADILRTLYLRAKQALPYESISGAVITVPAYFDEAQRQATKDAAKVAGINVLRLINEPTAAAMAYGLDDSSNNTNDSTDINAERKILIYDLGGGTFDVSILRLSEGVFEVLATGGNSALGGDDIDRLLMAWLLKQTGVDIKNVSTATKANLARQAQQFKHLLTMQDSVAVDVNVTDNEGASHSWQGDLSEAQLNEVIAPVTRRTLSACEQVLRDAKLTIAQLDDVILVGGSTRMPIVKKAVSDFFQMTPLSHLNPDEVVALGAAEVAQQLINDNKSDNTLLLDVTPLSLGLETMGGLVEVLIPRNTPIPVTKRQIFTTYQDGQTGMVIHVVQGERETVDSNRSLGRFELYGIPPMKAGLARIEVTFAIDTDGQLAVSAEETTTRTKSSVTIKPSYGLSETQQEQLLQAGFSHAEEDKLARKLIETKVEAKRELLALESALQEFDTLITESEIADLQVAMRNLSEALVDTDTDNMITDNTNGSPSDEGNSSASDFTLAFEKISQAQANLKPLSDAFAARIMNQSINQSLAGTSTDSWS